MGRHGNRQQARFEASLVQLFGHLRDARLTTGKHHALGTIDHRQRDISHACQPGCDRGGRGHDGDHAAHGGFHQPATRDDQAQPSLQREDPGRVGGGKVAKGIYRFEFDPATGKLTNGELAAEVPNPGFLAIHPNGKFLYAVSEQAGGVLAYSIDAKTGKLTKLNTQPAKGSGPCHINVDRTGKYVLIANYGSGSTNVFPIDEDGKPRPVSA